MDETSLSLHPLLRKCWMKRGMQKRIPAPGQQAHHHIFGAYNWCTDEIIWMDAETKNTQAFICFLEHFVTTVKTDRPIVFVLDNASYHHSHAAEAALARFEDDGLVTCWLPPYCSDLNPIERFWGHMKNFACANKLFSDIAHLVASVNLCLHIQSDPNYEHHFCFLKT